MKGGTGAVGWRLLPGAYWVLGCVRCSLGSSSLRWRAPGSAAIRLRMSASLRFRRPGYRRTRSEALNYAARRGEFRGTVGTGRGVGEA